MKPKTPTIDLSNAKIGQRLRLRSGVIVTFGAIDLNTGTKFKYDAARPCYYSWMQNGRFFSNGESTTDVVEILPLPKRKVEEAKPELLEISDAGDGKAIAKIAMKLHGGKSSSKELSDWDKHAIRRVINILEALL